MLTKPEPAFITPEEYMILKRISRTTVYRHLTAGMIPGAEQLAGKRGAWRIPNPAVTTRGAHTAA